MRPDPAAPLPDVEPPHTTIRALDALGEEQLFVEARATDARV